MKHNSFDFTLQTEYLNILYNNIFAVYKKVYKIIFLTILYNETNII